MTRFSANLGFLWADMPLPQAIHAAARAGFEAVECHWPYAVPAAEIRAALTATGLPMVGLNTARGKVAAGEFGLSALPGRAPEARAAIDAAIAYADAIDARAIHVMAGRATGAEADAVFRDNLLYACMRAPHRTILIEPINPHDAPGYFLHSTDQAARIIAGMDATNLKLMFDCYHVGRTEGRVTHRLRALLPLIGHVQVAAVPDRGPPDGGTLDYAEVFCTLAKLGWTAPIGAEYRPVGPTEASLGWMAALRVS